MFIQAHLADTDHSESHFLDIKMAIFCKMKLIEETKWKLSIRYK